MCNKTKIISPEKGRKYFHRVGPIKPWGLQNMKPTFLDIKQSCLNGRGRKTDFQPSRRQISMADKTRGLCVFSSSCANLERQLTKRLARPEGGQRVGPCPGAATRWTWASEPLPGRSTETQPLGCLPWEEPWRERENRHAPAPTLNFK